MKYLIIVKLSRRRTPEEFDYDSTQSKALHLNGK